MYTYTTLVNYIALTNKISYSYEYNNNYIFIRIRIGVIIKYSIYKDLTPFLYNKKAELVVLMLI